MRHPATQEFHLRPRSSHPSSQEFPSFDLPEFHPRRRLAHAGSEYRYAPEVSIVVSDGWLSWTGMAIVGWDGYRCLGWLSLLGMSIVVWDDYRYGRGRLSLSRMGIGVEDGYRRRG